jgi:tRNA A-37 threonylcarbamoyl transferase component Bud32
MNWIMVKEYQDLIPEISTIPDNLPVHAHVIKENMIRASVIISLKGNGEVFVKRYKMRGWGETFKYLFLPSKADKEWKNIRLFHKYHLPTVTPIARGEKRRWSLLKDSLLITQNIPNCHTLKELFFSVRNRSSRETLEKKREIINELARQIRLIHAHGFFHRDLHAGNILIKEEPSRMFNLFFVDLHKAWHVRRIPLLARIRDLAQFQNSLPSTRCDRIRFLKAYLQENDPPLLMMTSAIDQYAKRLKRVRLRSRTKRCLIPSSEFMVKKGFKRNLYCKRKYGEDFYEAIVKEYQDTKAGRRIHLLKEQSKSSVFFLTIPWKGENLTACLKEFKYPTLSYALRHSLSRSRALKSWVAAHGLRVRGFLTPEPLALSEERKGGILSRSLLLSEYLQGVEELNDYILKNFDTPLSPEGKRKKRRFVEHLSEEIRRLHESGIFQHDLKSNNILVKEKDDDWQFFFIDLDRIKFKKELSYQERVKNLAQINASVADCITVSDRLRFFKSYAAKTHLFAQRKMIYREVTEIGREKVTEPYRLSFKKKV